MKRPKQMKANDWIVARLLLLHLATDASSACVTDIQKSIDYLRDTFGPDALHNAFEAIRKEHIANKVWDQPDAMMMRDLQKSFTTKGQDEWSTVEHYSQWGKNV